MAALLRRGLQEEGFAVDVAGYRRGRRLVRHRERLRRDPARRDAARRRRVRGLPAPARGGSVGADPDAHRARRRAGPRRGPGCRRRRLPHQAVLLRRAVRARPGAPASRALGATTRPRRRATSSSIRRPAGSPAASGTSTSPRRSSVSSSCSCAIRARRCRARASSSTSGTSPTTAIRTWSTCTCGTCERRSTARSAAGRSRPCGAWAIASGRSASAAGDPDAVDDRLRRALGRGGRRRRRGAGGRLPGGARPHGGRRAADQAGILRRRSDRCRGCGDGRRVRTVRASGRNAREELGSHRPAPPRVPDGIARRRPLLRPRRANGRGTGAGPAPGRTGRERRRPRPRRRRRGSAGRDRTSDGSRRCRGADPR